MSLFTFGWTPLSAPNLIVQHYDSPERPIILLKPTLTGTTNGYGNIKLQWDNIKNAKSYLIYANGVLIEEVTTNYWSKYFDSEAVINFYIIAKNNTYLSIPSESLFLVPKQIFIPTYNDYLQAVKEKTIYPKFKIEFLNEDETPSFEIINDISSDSGNLTINYVQGCRRSCSLTLYNFDKKYLPSEKNPIWINNKFKLYLGINIRGKDYWQSAGIFVLQNPEVLNNFSTKTVNISGLDKFSLLDGQLNGQLDNIYQLAVGQNIETAIRTVLAFDNGRGGKIDSIDPVIDTTIKNNTLSYTIRKEAGATLGEILIELANSVSCDIYYDTEGRLRIESALADLSGMNNTTIWSYTTEEMEYLGSSISYQFDKVFTVVKVIGDNINGSIATGIATNTNPFSPTRVSVVGKKTKIINDQNIGTNDLAKQRADYELKKASILQSIVKLTSTFMVHLDVNKVISLTDDYYNFYDERFLIQTLNIPLSVNSKISIDASNVRELPYYNK